MLRENWADDEDVSRFWRPCTAPCCARAPDAPAARRGGWGVAERRAGGERQKDGSRGGEGRGKDADGSKSQIGRASKGMREARREA